MTLVASERNPPTLPVVPQAAIQFSREGRAVLVVTPDNGVERRPIEVGRTIDNMSAVTKGLNGGETLILRGSAKVKEGTKVRPVTQQQAEAEAQARRQTRQPSEGGQGTEGEGAGGKALRPWRQRDRGRCVVGFVRFGLVRPMISDLFIRRPRLAGVISIVVVLAGLLAILVLPVSQYPEITPPTVSVSANYPGADSTVLAQAVGDPLERAINGVEDMIYMSSTSTDSGTYSLSITFAIGTDPDIAQVNVSNRVQLATAQLPEAVTRQGVTVRSRSPNFLMAVAFFSEGGQISTIDIGAYLSSDVVTSLQRVEGVGDANVLGNADYSMRVWTDPARMAALSIAPSDITAAIAAENLPASTGQIGGAPAPDGQALVYTITSQGQLNTAEQFENIVVRAEPSGAIVRLKDVARVELGSESYAVNTYVRDNPGKTIQINQAPGANALQTVTAIRAELDRLQTSFPQGLQYEIIYDSTQFVDATIHEIVLTLAITAVIIVVVVFVFLQDWRSTLIPALAIPVSLIGTFAVLLAIGFTINVITLLALILPSASWWTTPFWWSKTSSAS